MIDRTELDFEIELLGRQIDREPSTARRLQLCAAYTALKWVASPNAMCPITRGLPWEVPQRRVGATLTVVRPRHPPPLDDPSIDDARARGTCD